MTTGSMGNPADPTAEPQMPRQIATSADPGANPAWHATSSIPGTVTVSSRTNTSLRSATQSGARAVAAAAYHVSRLGPAGIVGIGASIAAAATITVALAAVQRTTQDLAAQITAARHKPSIVRPETELANVVTSLPGRDAMPGVVSQVWQQAVLAGVSLTNGHYTYSPPTGAGVARYELDFPIKAQYPGIRDFINRTLAAVPAAALDKLQIQRKVVGDTLVTADVRFVVFVHAEAEK
jgi:hypothetical protein